MTEKGSTRKLTAIFYADVAGYSRLTGIDELGTHQVVMDLLDFTQKTIQQQGGTVLRYAGDAILAEFSSVVSCVNAAITTQTELASRNQDIPEDQQVLIRIGINLGEVIEDRGEIYGDGVNIAARLEALAPPGGICITSQVAEQIADKLEVSFTNAGRHKLKNISKPVEIWCWPVEGARKLIRDASSWRKKITLAVAPVAVLLALGYVYLHNVFDNSVPSGPRIAVIPFENLSGNQEDVYFSDGLSKDINAHLSKFSNLFVIAPSSVRDFGKASKCEDVRSELQVDFILEGTVRRAQEKLRVTTTFTDAKTCRQLDAPGPFDRDLNAANILDVQLEIAKKVVAQIGSADAPLFNAKVQKEIRRKAPDKLEAYECVLLSYWFYENFEPDRQRKARTCLERAVQIDPDYSLAWSRLAFSYIESKKYAIDTPAEWADLARSAADQAIALDPDNPDAYYALAILTQMTSQVFAEFQNFSDRSVSLNPNDAFVLADLGTWMGYAGQWEKSKEWVSRSMQLNPKHQSWLWQTWHLDYFLKGEYAKSRDMALKMNLPGNYMVQASLASAYAMNGEQEKAEQTLAHVLELRPNFSEDPRAPFRSRGMSMDLVEGIMVGLRRAGLDVEPAVPGD
jgi:class 3 adenylate cyclase/TolB-like protein/Tfp pilus assembly protein PilF